MYFYIELQRQLNDGNLDTWLKSQFKDKLDSSSTIDYTRLTRSSTSTPFQEGIGQGKNVTNSNFKTFVDEKKSMNQDLNLRYIFKLSLTKTANKFDTKLFGSRDQNNKNLLASILRF